MFFFLRHILYRTSANLSYVSQYFYNFYKTTNILTLLTATMVKLQKKVLNSRQKSSEKIGGSWPLQPSASISVALYCYISYEISFCFKVFSECVRSWSGNVLWSYGTFKKVNRICKWNDVYSYLKLLMMNISYSSI